MKNNLQIEYVPIETLKPNEYNPKQMSEKEAKDLEKSIVEFGIVDPLIINKAIGREGIIIGGHQRYKVYQKLKYEKVPVIWLDVPDLNKEQELCLRLSKNMGSWDYDLLVNFNEDLLKDIGWESSELDEIFGLEIDDEFDVEKELEKVLAGKERRCKEGDLWQLGDHKLLIGNCTDRNNWEKLLGDKRFDLMLTDPPYRIGYGVNIRKQKTKNGMKLQKARTYDTIGITTKEGKPIDENFPVIKFGYKQNREYLGTTQTKGVPEYDEWLSIAKDFQSPIGVNVMIFENWKNTPELWQAIEKYWRVKNMIIWHLTNRCQGFSARYKFFSKYDIAPLAGEGIKNEEYEEELDNYLQEKGQKLLDTYEVILYGNKGKSYWDKKKGTRWARVNDHITWSAATGKSGGQSIIFGTKPIQILVPYLKILSPRNGIVMEPFCGSGSTIIASEIMKRRCFAIEISDIYAEVILARWERFTGKTAQSLN